MKRLPHWKADAGYSQPKLARVKLFSDCLKEKQVELIQDSRHNLGGGRTVDSATAAGPSIPLPRQVLHSDHPVHRVLIHSGIYKGIFGQIDEIAHEYPILAEFNKVGIIDVTRFWADLKIAKIVSDKHEITRALVKMEKEKWIEIDAKVSGTYRLYINKGTLKATELLKEKFRQHADLYWITITNSPPPASWSESGAWVSFNNEVFRFYRHEHWLIWEQFLVAIAGDGTELFAILKGTPYWVALHIFLYNRHDFIANDMPAIAAQFGLGLTFPTLKKAFDDLLHHRILLEQNGRYVLPDAMSKSATVFEDELRTKFSILAKKCADFS